MLSLTSCSFSGEFLALNNREPLASPHSLLSRYLPKVPNFPPSVLIAPLTPIRCLPSFSKVCGPGECFILYTYTYNTTTLSPRRLSPKIIHCLDQRWANLPHKGPRSKYFRLCGFCGFNSAIVAQKRPRQNAGE